MDEAREENPAANNKPIIDRGLPSVARDPKGQFIFMGIFLGVAIIAIILVVITEMKRDEAKSIVAPAETVFKGPASTGEPYIQPERPEASPETPTPAEKFEPIDPMAAQRELMMQQEALRMAAEQKKRAEERRRSPPTYS
jgi:hypothetical protein